jgi:hypothetical protein
VKIKDKNILKKIEFGNEFAWIKIIITQIYNISAKQIQIPYFGTDPRLKYCFNSEKCSLVFHADCIKWLKEIVFYHNQISKCFISLLCPRDNADLFCTGNLELNII